MRDAELSIIGGAALNAKVAENPDARFIVMSRAASNLYSEVLAVTMGIQVLVDPYCPNDQVHLFKDDPRSAVKSCRNCEFWSKAEPHPSAQETGQCRRYAPIGQGHPQVDPDHWCGEFVSRYDQTYGVHLSERGSRVVAERRLRYGNG